MTEQVQPVVPGCAGTDGEAWFSTDRATVALCQRICAGCPLRTACLAGAMARDEQYGIWGGRLFERRWVSGRVFHHQGWWAVGQDGHGLPVFAFSPSRARLEQRLANLLAEGRRRGRLVELVRATGHPVDESRRFWTGSWDTGNATGVASHLGVAA